MRPGEKGFSVNIFYTLDTIANRSSFLTPDKENSINKTVFSKSKIAPWLGPKGAELQYNTFRATPTVCVAILTVRYALLCL